MKKNNMIFPKRFEGMDPDLLMVEVIHSINGKLVQSLYPSLADAEALLDLNKFMGPMVGRIIGPIGGNAKGIDCLRFEDREAYKKLSE